MHYRVIKLHRPDSPEPFVARKGERLTFERRPTHWDGWLYCTSDNGSSGWVPEDYVDIEGSRCTMRRDYNAFELTLAIGDTIAAIFEEAGWVWGRTPDGRAGWVPLDNLEPVP